MRSSLRRLAVAAALLAPIVVFSVPGVASARGSGGSNSVKGKRYHVKVKIEHEVDDAPDWTESYWTTLDFEPDHDFDDGDFDGEWKKSDGKWIASVSDDFEDWLEWDWFADDADGWFKYYDIEVDGDEIKGKLKGEIDIEYDFFFFDEDYEEDFEGWFWGHEIDDD